MSSDEGDCQETICMEGDPSGNYKNYAKKRFQRMKEMYNEPVSFDDGDEFSLTTGPEEAEDNDEFYDSCPNTRESLGFFTWNYLHTMTMHYPVKPTQKDQEDMKQFMGTFARFYPCKRKYT